VVRVYVYNAVNLTPVDKLDIAPITRGQALAMERETANPYVKLCVRRRVVYLDHDAFSEGRVVSGLNRIAGG